MLQGERPMAADNKTLGKFHLVGIPPAPRGVPQVEVTFDIDANGIVNVSAKDVGTGREQKITITASSGLSKEEIDKMMKDAESHAGEDEKKKGEIEARNRLDGLVYSVEKIVQREQGQARCGRSRRDRNRDRRIEDGLGGDDADAMNNAFERLQTASHKLAEVLYSQAGAAPAAKRPTTNRLLRQVQALTATAVDLGIGRQCHRRRIRRCRRRRRRSKQ